MNLANFLVSGSSSFPNNLELVYYAEVENNQNTCQFSYDGASHPRADCVMLREKKPKELHLRLYRPHLAC